jgi:multisubunit Na+/H+ antiporter MnhE subunit
MSRTVLGWLGWWTAFAGLYLLLADTVVGPELAVGAAAAALGATAATLVRPRPVRPPIRWLFAGITSLPRLVTDLVPLARALPTRGSAGAQFVEVPFAATGDAAHDAARRAWTEAVGSLGPNTVVVDIDRERGVLLAHQLLPTPDAAERAAPLP